MLYLNYKGKTWIKIRLFTGELNNIRALWGVPSFFVFSTYRTVCQEFVLATINLMFETNGILISK